MNCDELYYYLAAGAWSAQIAYDAMIHNIIPIHTALTKKYRNTQSF